MGLGHALAKEFQASLSQVHHFALVFFLKVGFRIDLAVRNVSNVFDDVIGLTNETNQGLVFRFEQLQQGPDGNMLEGGVTRLKEAAEVAVNAAVGFVPVLDEDGVVAN